MRTALLAVVILSSTACEVRTSTSSSSSYSSAQPIGGACEDSGDCQGSALCGTNFPGGYCFMTCTGNASVCPSNSMCVRMDSNSSAQCYKTCLNSTDCRLGYQCFDVTGSAKGVCLPR